MLMTASLANAVNGMGLKEADTTFTGLASGGCGFGSELRRMSVFLLLGGRCAGAGSGEWCGLRGAE